jgi:hypothetical protein
MVLFTRLVDWAGLSRPRRKFNGCCSVATNHAAPARFGTLKRVGSCGRSQRGQALGRTFLWTMKKS